MPMRRSNLNIIGVIGLDFTLLYNDFRVGRGGGGRAGGGRGVVGGGGGGGGGGGLGVFW